MRSINKTIFALTCLFSCQFLQSQTTDEMARFIDNIVMVHSYHEGYGFIVGTEEGNKNPYFILIKNNSYFDEKVAVSYNKSGRDKNATLIRKDLRFNRFYLGLYMINGTHEVSKKYYRSTKDNSDAYFSFLNGGATIGELDLAFNQQSRYKRIYDKNNYLESPILFSREKLKQRVFPGMPMVDGHGSLAGLIAMDNNDSEENGFYVIDVMAIQHILSNAGKKAGNKCKYFNLVEQNAPNDETICEQSARAQRLEKKRLEEEEEKRIVALKQQDKMNIDRKVRDSGKAALHPVERRIYNRNLNRWVAIGPAVTGGVQFTSMKGGKSAFGSYYSLGANIYLNPDKIGLRFTLKPRYTKQLIKVDSAYSYGTTKSGFKLSNVNARIYELPAILEIVTSRKEKVNNYFGLGYGVSKVQEASFEFSTAGSEKRKQEVVGNPRYIHNLIFYIGVETCRFRFDFGLSYQMQSLTDKNYEMIVGGEVITPFKDMPKKPLALTVDVSMRLWNQWRNDYRTMY